MTKLQYFVLICNQKSKEKFLELLVSQGGQSIDTVYGRGSAKAGFLAKAFGFETEEKKAVLTCLMPAEKAAALIDILCETYHFAASNTGIAFCIPVDGLAF